MLVLISPAKSQNFDTPSPVKTATQPVFQQHVNQLIRICRRLDESELAKLMSISPKLAALNHQRYQAFDPDHYDLSNAKQALFAFQGDVYKGLDAQTLDQDSIAFCQDHLAIISGLYGLLRPLDLIQPYRLEMKTKLHTPKGKDLYAFWSTQLTQQLNQWLQPHAEHTIVNLASNEYFQATCPNMIKGRILTIDFKESKEGQLKTVGIHAKRARGLMSRYILTHQITHSEPLKHFAEAGYQFQSELSQTDRWVFVR